MQNEKPNQKLLAQTVLHILHSPFFLLHGNRSDNRPAGPPGTEFL